MKATLAQECRNDKVLWVTNSTPRSQRKAISHSSAHRLVILLLQTANSNCRCQTRRLPPAARFKAGFTPPIHTLPGLSQSRARGGGLSAPRCGCIPAAGALSPKTENCPISPTKLLLTNIHAATSRAEQRKVFWRESAVCFFLLFLKHSSGRQRKAVHRAPLLSATISI